MGPSSAIFGIDAGIAHTPGDVSARMHADREHLTRRLRALAGALDELERRLSNLVWTRDSTTLIGRSEARARRSELEAQRAQLNTRLRGLAQQLSDLDGALSALAGDPQLTTDRVGVCPHCGYPSLSSALCARCRSLPAR